MALMLERVPVERISARAREVRFWRTVRLVIAGLLFGLGWLAFKVVALAWAGFVWCAVAVAEGWTTARKGQRGPARTG